MVGFDRVDIDPSTNAGTKSTGSGSMSALTGARASGAALAPLKGRRTVAIDLACRLAIAPALLIAPFVAIDRAAAACDPPTPANGVDVTCTGTTGSLNTPVGYGNATFIPNSITVQSGASVTGSNFGLQFNTGTVNNSGTITGGANGFGIGGAFVNVTNFSSGTITAGAGGAGVFGGSTATVDNFGKITAGAGGLGVVAGTANVTNRSSGTITAGAGGFGIQAGIANVQNFGTISAGVGGTGIFGITADVKNSGTITAGSFGIQAADTATVVNSGTITAGDSGVSASAVKVTNFGTIAGSTGSGIIASNAEVINSGTITTGALGTAGISAETAKVTNSGTIAAGAVGAGIFAQGSGNTVTNTGTIIGGTAIVAVNGASTITNSATIVGLNGTAILLGNQADTLTLLPGSRILGAISMGGGNDVVNFVSGGGMAQLVTLNNFTGTINTSGVGPIVHSTTQIATLDATAFGQTDRTLLDFTGGVSSLVQSRLGGAPPNGSIQAVSYGPDAMPNGLIRKAPAMGYAAPTVVWTGGFGGTRSQDASGDFFRSSSTVWGGVLGVDRQVRGDLLLGAFVGGGTGRLTVNKSAESVNTDYVGGGVYGRFDWASQFLDFTVQGGSADNKSTRLVMSNLATATNGQETATARYSGWFVSPELTYGMRYAIGNGNTLTPFARVRYLAGIFDGYSEQGSGQNLSIGGRTLQNLEERGELELSRTASFGDNTMRTSLHGGVIALQRIGDTSINGVLVGQSFSFATPGKDSTVGAVAGAGFDVTIDKRASVFGGVEGTVMSDKSHAVTGKAGVRVGF